MIAFLLHLYQPSYQDEAVFREITAECYIPLLKLIKHHKDCKFSLNTPLSLLEQMDKYGYTVWLEDLRKLVESGQVELVGSAAYHPLLTKVPKEIIEQEIILNEYALGYYFGKKQGLEGEPAILLNALPGFFPPELAVSTDVLTVLESLSYNWVVVDPSVFEDKKETDNCAFTINNYSLKLITRDIKLCDYFAFKRDEDITNIPLNQNKHSLVVLDAETFGHHNKKGINLLYNTLSKLIADKNAPIHINSMLNTTEHANITTISESTWAHSKQESVNNDIYHLWNAKTSLTNKIQWEMFEYVLSNVKVSYIPTSNPDLANIKLWDEGEVLGTIEDNNSKLNVVKLLLLHKCLSSDQFWWASGEEVVKGQMLISDYMLSAANSQYKKLASVFGSQVFTAKILEYILNIETTFKEMKR